MIMSDWGYKAPSWESGPKRHSFPSGCNYYWMHPNLATKSFLTSQTFNKTSRHTALPRAQGSLASGLQLRPSGFHTSQGYQECLILHSQTSPSDIDSHQVKLPQFAALQTHPHLIDAKWLAPIYSWNIPSPQGTHYLRGTVFIPMLFTSLFTMKALRKIVSS